MLMKEMLGFRSALVALSIILITSGVSAKSADPISDTIIENTSYHVSVPKKAPQTITLKKGECTVKQSWGEEFYSISNKAFGDLNDDNVLDAAVVIQSSAGGSGSGFSLYAVIAGEGEPQITEPVDFGQVAVKGIRIEGESIILNLSTYKQGDPNCCPSLKTSVTFKLKDGKLVKTNGKVINWGKELKL